MLHWQEIAKFAVTIPLLTMSASKTLRALLLCVMLLGCSTATASPDWLRLLSGLVKAGEAATLADEDLAEIVGQAVEQMDEENKVAGKSNAYTKRLKRLTDGMTDADGIALNFKVYLTSEANAFACPDGSVRVYSGLMDMLTDNELLGVIGHEIGHVALRHSKKAWRSALLRSAASDLIGSASDTWAALSDSMLGDITSVALTAKHSRYHETQADDYGYDFLKAHGKNPWAMGEAFKKLKSLSKRTGDKRLEKLLQLFADHPDFDERIEHMRKRAKSDGYL